MKKFEFKRLLKLLDSEQFNESDGQLFADPEEARAMYTELRHLRENAGFKDFQFNPFFKDMIMRKVYDLAATQTLDEVLARFMSRVMLAGTLTVVFVILLLFAYHGQLGVDTLTGIENDTQIDFITLLFNEY